MKLCYLPTLCAALLALCPTLVTAQTTAVPGFISYQGRVVDAAGVVGAGTPVNRTIIFRIWDNPSSTAAVNLIYSESQTVTVSEGEFSALVGQGVANTMPTFGYSESGTDKKLADFSAAFNRSPLYLGVTVAAENAIATTDNEISPRQQIVSTAFAMRAKVAESVNGLAITTAMLANNAVTTTQVNDAAITTSKLAANAVTTTQITDATITGAKIATDTIVSGNIAAGAVGTSEILDGAVATVDIAVGAVTTAKIATDTILATNIAAGAVSTSELAAGSVTYDKLAASNQLAVTTTGVGINNTLPLGKFTVNSGASAFTINNTDVSTGAWIRNDGLNTVFSTNLGDMYFGYAGPLKNLNFMNGPNVVMNVNKNGNVGIGKTDPSVPLDVAGTIKESGQHVPSSEEDLRIIRGAGTANAALNVVQTPLHGSGFTYKKISAGTVEVTFNTPFAGTPTVTANPITSGAIFCGLHGPNGGFNPTTTGFRIVMYDTAGAGRDWPFNFIAIGPR